MPNYSPIFTSSADVSWASAPISGTNYVGGTALAAYDGTSASYLVHTANANGSFVQKLVCEANGNTVGTIPACVLRIYINNSSPVTTATNNTLYYQFSLPAVPRSDTTATAHIEIPLLLQLPPNYRIYVSISSTASLLGGWVVTAIAGEY